MAKRTERQKLEAELVRIDRTRALDLKQLEYYRASLDKLASYRLEIEARLARLEKPK